MLAFYEMISGNKTHFEAREVYRNIGVLIVDLEGHKEEFLLTSPRITIGRNSKASIRINYKQISGFHAVIYNRNYEYYIKDCMSSNRTSVNQIKVTSYEVVDKNGNLNQTVEGQQPGQIIDDKGVRLKSGDALMFGNIEAVFRIMSKQITQSANEPARQIQIDENLGLFV
jgi:pSer/pThr/pTyr-binding forkhead associated (FHA) protein